MISLMIDKVTSLFWKSLIERLFIKSVLKSISMLLCCFVNQGLFPPSASSNPRRQQPSEHQLIIEHFNYFDFGQCHDDALYEIAASPSPSTASENLSASHNPLTTLSLFLKISLLRIWETKDDVNAIRGTRIALGVIKPFFPSGGK